MNFISQTIFLKKRQRPNFKSKINQYLYYAFLITSLSVIIFYQFQNNSTTELYFYPFYFLILGFYWLVLKNPKLKYAPRITITENKLKVKQTALGKTRTYTLNDLKEIKLASFQFTLFYLNSEQKHIKYSCTADESREVKKGLREWAAFKQIGIGY